MIPEIERATAPDLQKWWVQIPERLLRGDDSEELILEQIASALLQKDPEWIAFLSQYAYSEDISRRKAALAVLADKTNATPATERILLDAFHTETADLKLTALLGFIQARLFPLTPKELAALGKSDDELLRAWGMTYLCYALPEMRVEVLRKALQSPNPHVREHACDVIGDERIEDLKEEMKPLLEDPDERVAEAAKYNYFEMFD